ncbi:MAG: hypothetical protein JOY58_15035, partial [Solirubrobacterales bacterium]|nr:hypothetical protein [Solirubrobacterales bacterium]
MISSPAAAQQRAPAPAPPGRRRRVLSVAQLARSYGLSALVFLLILGIWEAVSRGGLVAVYILPAPDQVITELYRDWSSVLRSATLVTLEEMFIGFLIAVAVGLGI